MLSDWQISKAVKKGKLKISPFNIQNVNPNSYDITLGREFQPMDMDIVIDPRKRLIGGTTVNTDEYIIPPGEHVLGHTIEEFTIPNGMVAILYGKSSWARLGISNNMAGFIDSGFSGDITLELVNANKKASVILREGDRIGQIVFYKTKKSKVPYDIKAGSKYMNQRGATPSMYFKNIFGGTNANITV